MMFEKNDLTMNRQAISNRVYALDVKLFSPIKILKTLILTHKSNQLDLGKTIWLFDVSMMIVMRKLNTD